MSATVPTGLCESQSFPYQNATAKQTTIEETNRPQKAPPIVLTFSRIEPPIDLQTLVSQPRILFLPIYAYSFMVDKKHYTCYVFAYGVSRLPGNRKATPTYSAALRNTPGGARPVNLSGRNASANPSSTSITLGPCRLGISPSNR